MNTGCFPSCHGKIPHHLIQRVLHFIQIGYLCRPVIHFCIDVDGVLLPQGRIHFIVPYSLQIGRLTAGRRGGDQQVSSILKNTVLPVADRYCSRNLSIADPSDD
jgi:hypothetical protein